MSTHTTSRRTAGIALAGAGAITLATMAPATETPRIDAGAVLSVALTAVTNPLQAFIDDVTTQVSITGAQRVNNPIEVAPGDEAAHIAAGLVASVIRTGQGIALAPQQFAALTSAIATGDEATATAAIRDVIDGPLWAADPALLSLWEAAPAPIGGDAGAVWNFREQWRAGAISLEDYIIGKLYPAGTTTMAAAAESPLQTFIADVQNQVSISGATRVNNPQTVPQDQALSHIAAGLAASAIRTVQGLVLAPQQVTKLVTALSGSDKQGASEAIVDLIDGPLWAADPALLSAWEAAPKPIGGEGDYTGAAWNVREQWRTAGNTIESNILDRLDLPKPPKLQDTVKPDLRTVTLTVAAPQAAATTDKGASDQKVTSGNRAEPKKKADANSSGRHRKGTFGAHRDSGATKSKTGDKSSAK